jgi:uncharacterized RDD family membrane protein YckC
MNKELRPSIIKRLLALLVDTILLGILGYLLGIFFEDFFVSLGKYGTLLGSSIAILYFSILQSHIGKGQSVGKMVLNIRVTDLKGNFLTLEKSFLRSFILIFPVMNAEIFSGGKAMIIILMIIILSIFISAYFILVNKSRRCLHDILTPSVVTYQYVTAFEVDELNDRSKKKLIPVIVLAVLMIGVGVYQMVAENAFSQLLNAKEKIEERPGVIGVNKVESKTTTYYGEPSKTYTSIYVSVRINNKQAASDLNSQYFNELYEIIKQEIPEAEKVDGVTITLYYGYNIGISSKTTSVTKTIEK